MEVSHLALLGRRSLSALVTCSLVGSLACSPVGLAYALSVDDESNTLGVESAEEVIEQVQIEFNDEETPTLGGSDSGELLQEGNISEVPSADLNQAIDGEVDGELEGFEIQKTLVASSAEQDASSADGKDGVDNRDAADKGATKIAAQSIEAGKAGQTIETADGTWTVDAGENKNLTITGFTSNEPLDNLTVPSSLKVGEDTYAVSTVRLLPQDSSFTANQVTISAGLSVTDLSALTTAGTVSLVLGDGVSYSAGTFRGQSKGVPNTQLSSLAIGSGVVFGSAATFQFNTNLSSLTIGSGVAFQPSHFQGCTSLATVNLNGNATTSSMFNGCTSLTAVSGVSGAIADSAFKSCTFTSFDFSSVSGSIGESAFDSCKSLAGELSFSNMAIGKKAFNQTVVTSLNISGGSIGESAFNKCTKLRTVKADVTAIGNSAFASCKSIADLTIGSKISSIGETAFNEAFANNYNIAFDDSQNERYHWNEGKTAILDDYGLQVCPYSKDDANISSIREINSITSGKTGNNAYKNNYDTNKCELIVNKCVETINRSIFGATGKTFYSFNVVEGNKYFKVVDGALYSYDGTHLVKAPMNATEFDVPEGVTHIDQSAFANSAELQRVSLPSTLVSIDRLAFSECGKLVSIELPESIEDIGVKAFSGTALTSFKANESLWTNRDYSSFTQDGAVPNLNWLFVNGESTTPDSAAAWLAGTPLYTTLNVLDLSDYQASFIPYYAFAGLSGITEVQIPSTVTRIGSGSFYYCDNLMTVYCYAPDSMVIDMANTGHGDSGSGDANESYVINAPGAFSYWDAQKEPATDGTGSQFEDRTGITFYGCAYNNDLRVWCGSYGQTFIPVVTLQTLSGVDNPFWNKTMASSFAIDYGNSIADYGYVTIADIDKGGTPQVVAKFGAYSGTRDLTDDAACTIVYYDPDGNAVTSFDKDGVYTASLVGDGKSVFGARMVKFNVGVVEEPAAEEPGDSKADDIASEPPVADNANAGASNTARATTQVASQGVRTVYQTMYAPAANAVQGVESGNSNTYAVGDTALPAALGGIAGTDGSVLVWGGSNAASPQYVWEVPGTRLTAANIATIDFAVTDASKDAAVAGLVGDADFTAFTVKQAGSFPATYKLHWKTSSTFYDGAKVDVYRVVAASGATGSTSESAFVEKAYAADGDKSLELVKSGVVATDGYVTVDVDRGGTYVLVESGADVGLPLVEKAYADTGEIVAVDVDEGVQQASNWMMPAAVTAVVAAVVGACGGWFARGRRQDAGAEQTSGQKR